MEWLLAFSFVVVVVLLFGARDRLAALEERVSRLERSDADSDDWTIRDDKPDGPL